jgi:hypothetical protein
MFQIQCVFCQTQQHLLCYGYVSSGDINIPNTHVCYKCLLEPNESPLLHEMGTLVLLRWALKIIIEEGYPNRIRDFSQKLRELQYVTKSWCWFLNFSRLQRPDHCTSNRLVEKARVSAFNSWF